MVSIVIPSRNEIYLQNTIDDILKKARGKIEVIVVLDGYWPNPQLKDDPRVVIIHRGSPRGMRAAINAGVAIAKGKFVMKIDAHCMVDEGFDIKLANDCEANWVVIPRRYRLDPVNWKLKEVKKPPVDYEYLSYPNNPSDFGGAGLHGRQWNERTIKRMDKEQYLIDDDMSFQGSCWFMRRDYFYYLDLMDEENYGTFPQEAQEIGLKAWLSGGMVKVNKKTWYAHWHKGKTADGKSHNRGYFLSKRELAKGTAFTNKWISNSTGWKKQTLSFNWLIERFWPVPTWPEDRKLWETQPLGKN